MSIRDAIITNIKINLSKYQLRHIYIGQYKRNSRKKTREKQGTIIERKRKENEGRAYLPGVRRAVRSQVPGERGKLGEVGEWQCEVRWGARRVVARREQGAVGNVSRREWGKRHHKLLEEKEGEIPENASYIGEHLYSYPPAARNQPSWVLILR